MSLNSAPPTGPGLVAEAVRPYLLLTALPLILAATSPETTVVGGHSYHFPNSAFQGGMVTTGRVRALLLELNWPELTGLSLADQLRPAGTGTLLILGNSGAELGEAIPRTQLDESMRATIAGSVSRYGQQAFPLRPKQPASAIEPAPGDGMRPVEAEAGDGQDPDVFVSPTIEAPDELIKCSDMRTVSYPRCSQFFIDHDLLLQVSYERKLVAQWRQIHQAVVRYLTSKELPR